MVRASGNEVFALLGKTGARQCLVAATARRPPSCFRGLAKFEAPPPHKGTRTVQTEHQPTHARAGDQTIMNIAGHVSRAMLSRYSHVRMEAKRRAVDEIAARQCAADKKRKPEVERLQPLTTMATEPGSMGSCTNRRCLAS